MINGCVHTENKMANTNKKILMVIAPGNFRDEELLVPRQKFKDEGFEVVVTSTQKGISKGMLGYEILISKSLDELNFDEFDAVVFVGGSGVEEFKMYENPAVLNVAKKFYTDGKVVGAICLAPMILADVGILKDKEATVWTSASDYLEQKGALVSEKNVVVSGKIVTGNGPQAAEEFAEEVLGLLR